MKDKDSNNKDNGPLITVTVYAPKEPGPKTFTWKKNTKVGDAANEAAREFGYEEGDHTFVNADGVELDREKNLVAAGVRDGDTLELVNTGGGV